MKLGDKELYYSALGILHADGHVHSHAVTTVHYQVSVTGFGSWGCLCSGLEVEYFSISELILFNMNLALDSKEN